MRIKELGVRIARHTAATLKRDSALPNSLLAA